MEDYLLKKKNLAKNCVILLKRNRFSAKMVGDRHQGNDCIRFFCMCAKKASGGQIAQPLSGAS